MFATNTDDFHLSAPLVATKPKSLEEMDENDLWDLAFQSLEASDAVMKEAAASDLAAIDSRMPGSPPHKPISSAEPDLHSVPRSFSRTLVYEDGAPLDRNYDMTLAPVGDFESLSPFPSPTATHDLGLDILEETTASGRSSSLPEGAAMPLPGSFDDDWWILQPPSFPSAEDSSSFVREDSERPPRRRRLDYVRPDGSNFASDVEAPEYDDTDGFNPYTLTDTEQAVFALATIRDVCHHPTGAQLMSMFHTLLLGRPSALPDSSTFKALTVQTKFRAKKKYLARKQSFGLLPTYLEKYVPESTNRGNRKEQLVYHVLGVPRRVIPRIVEGSINVPGAVALLEAMCRHDPGLFCIPDSLQIK